jgi:hypothetical protein
MPCLDVGAGGPPHLDFISLISSESPSLKTLQGFRLIFAHTSRYLTKLKNQTQMTSRSIPFH